MRSILDSQSDSEAVVAGEYLTSPMLDRFSLKEKESDEMLIKKRKHLESWKTNHRKWKAKESKKRAKFEKQKRDDLEQVNYSIKLADKGDIEGLEIRRAKIQKNYYSPSDPPFPAADVSIQSQADYLASGEYIPKPYDIDSLIELIEGNQRLKSSVGVISRNSVGLGNIFRPTQQRNVADFSSEDLEKYFAQGLELLKWYNSKVESGKHFYQIAYQNSYNKHGLGEGYFEIIDNRAGKIVEIRTINPAYLFEGIYGDRFIWIKNGKKKYFKTFWDKSTRNSDDFSKGGPVSKRATRILPFREYNLISDVYGVPNWTGAIPQIIGHRYASERNVNFFNNDAVPRMAVLVSGGAVDGTTLANMKKFFQTRGKGRENAGRVLLLCVSGKNQLSPNSKPPTVKMEPLTVGKTDDGSFMTYQAGCEEVIREAFRISNTFYGTSGDSNRASAYTLRDQVVRTVFIPEGELMANLCNDTFTRDWAIQNKYIEENEDGEETKDELLVELAFVQLSTMSQKDERELAIASLIAGAITINDFRAEVLGMPRIDAFWAELPKTLAITLLQTSELSPALAAMMVNDPKLEAAIRQDKKEDVASGELGDVAVVDDTTKAIRYFRKGLSKVLSHEHVDEDTINSLNNLYSSIIKDLEKDDAESISKLLGNK